MDILNDVFKENPITLNFSFPEVCNCASNSHNISIIYVRKMSLCSVLASQNAGVVTKYAGAFWNFSDPYV